MSYYYFKVDKNNIDEIKKVDFEEYYSVKDKRMYVLYSIQEDVICNLKYYVCRYLNIKRNTENDMLNVIVKEMYYGYDYEEVGSYRKNDYYYFSVDILHFN